MYAIFDYFGGQTHLSQVVMIGVLIVFRCIPVIFLTPFLGGKLVPPTTKMAMAAGMAVLVFPFAHAQMTGPIELNAIVYIVLMLKELFIGYTIGFVASEIFYGMEVAGRALDVMRGSNMAEVQVPELSLRASPLGNFLFQLLVVIFIGVGGHRFFIEAMGEGFRIVPIDAWPGLSGGFLDFVERILHFTSNLFAVAFALVFPGLFATFMTDVVFGMLNRVAPQLNAYFMAMGVKAMAALALLFFALGLTTQTMERISADAVYFVRDLISRWG